MEEIKRIAEELEKLQLDLQDVEQQEKLSELLRCGLSFKVDAGGIHPLFRVFT